MGAKRDAYRILVAKSERRRPLKRPNSYTTGGF
jgi:hypothetical protein